MHNHTYAFVVDAVGLAVNSPTTVYRSTDICTWRFISYKNGTTEFPVHRPMWCDAL